MKKKIKVAQIGVGHDHAPDAFETLKLQNDLYELIGFADVAEDSKNPGCSYENRKHRFEGYPKMSVEEILNYPGLDAVVIETEDSALTKYAQLAADKGLHIHMDKPGGIDNDEFDRLVDTAKEKNLVLHLGYMYRYNPAYIQLKKDIADGKLGEIISVEAQMNCYHHAIKRAWLGNFPGGILYFLGCHMIDFVYSIMGKPDEIIPLSMSSGTCDTTAEDFGMAVFKYKTGISFAKSTSVEVGGFERRQLVVCGTKNTVVISPLEQYGDPTLGIYAPQTSGVRDTYPGGEENAKNWSLAPNRYTTETYGRYDAMFRAFYDYVTGESENPYDYEYEREQHKILLEACGKAL